MINSTNPVPPPRRNSRRNDDYESIAENADVEVTERQERRSEEGVHEVLEGGTGKEEPKGQEQDSSPGTSSLSPISESDEEQDPPSAFSPVGQVADQEREQAIETVRRRYGSRVRPQELPAPEGQEQESEQWQDARGGEEEAAHNRLAETWLHNRGYIWTMDPSRIGQAYKAPFWKRKPTERKTYTEEELADLPVEKPQQEQHQTSLTGTETAGRTSPWIVHAGPSSPPSTAGSGELGVHHEQAGAPPSTLHTFRGETGTEQEEKDQHGRRGGDQRSRADTDQGHVGQCEWAEEEDSEDEELERERRERVHNRREREKQLEREKIEGRKRHELAFGFRRTPDIDEPLTEKERFEAAYCKKYTSFVWDDEIAYALGRQTDEKKEIKATLKGMKEDLYYTDNAVQNALSVARATKRDNERAIGYIRELALDIKHTARTAEGVGATVEILIHEAQQEHRQKTARTYVKIGLSIVQLLLQIIAILLMIKIVTMPLAHASPTRNDDTTASSLPREWLLDIGYRWTMHSIRKAQDRLHGREVHASRGPRGSVRVGRSINLNHQETEFVALDCSEPANVTSVTVLQALSCRLPEVKIEETPATFRVLQQASSTRFPLYFCSARRYRQMYLCNWETGHTTMLGSEWVFDQEFQISIKECREIWEDQKWDNQRVKLNATTHLLVGRHGWEYMDPDDVHCYGEWGQYLRMQNTESAKSQSLTGVSNSMVKDHINIKTGTVQGTATASGDVMDWTRQIRLPCPLSAEACSIQDHGVYLWKNPPAEERCPLYSTRKEPVKGMIIADPSGLETFVSNDGSMVRLEKKVAQPRCGGLVYRTDFDHLFLTYEIGHPSFSRPLHESEVSVATYSAASNSFIYADIYNAIAVSSVAIRHQECQRDLAKRGAEYARKAAEQGAVIDGQTAFLGGRHFVSAIGEAWASYYCRPIKVHARKTDSCYDALPVTLTPHDRHRFLLARREGSTAARKDPRSHPPQEGTPGGTNRHPDYDQDQQETEVGTEFFIEPHSHRLTTVAHKRSCTYPLFPLYVNALGRWVSMDGGDFRAAAQPFVMEEMSWKPEPYITPQDYDFQDAGVYDGNTIRKMDLYSQAPRAGQGLAANLASREVASDLADQTIRSETIFPDLNSFKEVFSHPAIEFFSWFWRIVQTYGKICAIIVGTAIIFKFFKWLFDLVMRLFCTQPTGNIFNHVVVAFCPSMENFLERPSDACARNACCCLFWADSRRVYTHDDFIKTTYHRALPVDDDLPEDPNNAKDNDGLTAKDTKDQEEEAKEQRQKRLVEHYATTTADKVVNRIRDYNDPETVAMVPLYPGSAVASAAAAEAMARSNRTDPAALPASAPPPVAP